MKLKEIIDIDCRASEGVEKLKRALVKTSWLDRFEPEQITIEVLEKAYKKIEAKYPARISYISNAGDNSMLAMIKRTDNHRWIETVYFISFWECMAKTILVLYGYFIKGVKFKDKEKVQG